MTQKNDIICFCEFLSVEIESTAINREKVISNQKLFSGPEKNKMTKKWDANISGENHMLLFLILFFKKISAVWEGLKIRKCF